ncbi:conserved hypothetical protein [Aromatoleum aromaticum EbN1]|uniref:Uncharacterized protein n=2 Tax=Aromatoleum aromaticum TaxID=551760 RepID=Q5NZ13_AROAE|nr:conserved hypothetical protein [Aromatoleum aromaticum EbN1]
MMQDLRPPARLPLLVLGMLSLVGGVLAGLSRLALDMPVFAATQAGLHGALMIAAFFGTVISLERAVALARMWAYLAPACAGAGGLALLAGAPTLLAQVFFVAAALILVLGSVQVMRRQTVLFTVVLAVGALCWLVGNLAWLIENNVQAAVPWWLGFLVLTIAGERLELTRFLPSRPAAAPLFSVAVAVVLGGAATSLWREETGLAIFAGGLLFLAAWLLRYDIARHNARQKGLTRFIAICLLSGYAWLAVGALLGLGNSFAPGAAMRDAALHAITLGFVFAMVFGHAPIIFPAIARVKLPYHPVFYLPLAALHVSLATRIIGSAGEWYALRQLGAVLNGVALLLFIVTMVTSVLRGRKRGRV